ncbi:MAG TPA: hypothetical protein VKY40_05180, partial [Halanaerobiales bacterium]|nr:hypothetical protein [Halanaerobiales bacterium]
FASFGKRKAGLMVKYKRDPIIGSIIRNVLKFLPWQFGHMAVIRGIYNGFESYYVKIFYGLAILLPVIYTGMVLLRKDHRHIPDILAKSNVEVRQSKNKVN